MCGNHSGHIVQEKESNIERSKEQNRAATLSNEGASSRQTLDRSLVKGIAWVGVIKTGSQILSWVCTILVARILSPSDYGLVALASGFLGVIALLNDFGIGSAIVYLRRSVEQHVIPQLNSISLAFGFLGFAAALGAAAPLGNFYHMPDLPVVVMVLSVGFILSAIGSVPGALLEKGLRFRTLALLEGGKAVFASLLTVLLAFWGFHYWSLIIGGLSGNVIWVIGLLALCGFRLAMPTWAGLREIIHLSWQVCTGRLVWYGASTSDVFIAGRVVGPAALGAYDMGLGLANLPTDKISAVVGRVLPAVFSAARNDRAELLRYLLLVSEGLSLVALPIACGFALVSDDFVRIMLGEKWVEAIGPLQILSLSAGIRALFSPFPTIVLATGGVTLALWNAVLTAVTLPLGFYVGSHWGIVGIATVWLVVHPINMASMFYLAKQTLEFRLKVYLVALWPAISSAAVMAAVLVLLGNIIPESMPLLTRLVLKVGVGTVVYVGCIWVMHRTSIDHIYPLLEIMKKKPQAL